MKVQETRNNRTGSKAHTVFTLLLTIALTLTASTVLADGFGIDNGNANTAKINTLLQNIQAGDNGAVKDSQTQKVAAASHENKAAGDALGNPLEDAAFSNVAKTYLPLTPQQIKLLHYLFAQTQQATAQTPGIPPKPTSTSLGVNLSPGAVPPVIRLQQGYVSSLVFVDATGASWPIQAYDLGNEKSFNVQWDKKSNTLMVQALSGYESGNLAVMLKGLDTPIMITLTTGQRAVDYRVDLRIPKIGPNPNQVLEGLPGVENPQLMSVLDGIPPKGAQALVIHGGGEDCQGWILNGNIYLRTSMTVLSPAFISTMNSADGTHAYQLQVTPIILALSRGKTIKLTIEGL